MRKQLFLLAVLLAVSISPRAHADTFTDYTINFLGPAGTLFPTSGIIVYDNTPGALNPFSDFTVKWDGESFNFAAIANQYNYLAGSQTPALFNTSLPGCTGATGLQILIVAMVACAPDAIWAAQADTAANTASFTIAFPGVLDGIPIFADLLCCAIPPPTISARPGYDNGGGGLPLTITDPPRTTIPEPGTAALLCVGFGVAVLLGKRKVRRPVLTA
ncbi:MAG TPA: PEP-CTERM sorting domain-containing protein [Candidatus Acidoferrum sp.]|nr:PEP-CTERM sorting domain-containing protein [Candidatus Acidoferrum sp.]